MSNLFQSIKAPRIKKNFFNLSHENKLSLNMGDLVPFLCTETVPGDKFKLNSQILTRFAPLLAPVMHRFDVRTEFFFVPMRLVYKDFDKFFTGGTDGTQNYVPPQFQLTLQDSPYFVTGSLSDYLGVPSYDSKTFTSPIGVNISSMPFRAYQLIYNEFYRDENLIDPIEISLSGGISVIDSTNNQLLQLRKRAWEKDYFTSCLPFVQRGPDVRLPLNSQADVVYTKGDINKHGVLEPLDGTLVGGNVNTVKNNIGNSGSLYSSGDVNRVLEYNPNGTLKADLTTATGTTINELRRANALQKYFEATARGGVRYIEQILSLFGVVSSDSRLQRPQFLRSSSSPVVISEVLQTSSTQVDSPQGNMSGHALSISNQHGFTYTCEEHGFIMGIISIVPKPSYQQGMPRMFTRSDKFDYFIPQLAHIGEQPVLNRELYCAGDDQSWNNQVFGYQSRYAEYKYIPSSVHGDFKTSLNFWHDGRIFKAPNEPHLSQGFIEINNSEQDRIFATDQLNDDKIYLQIYNDLRAVRPMPKFGTPKF